MHYSGPELHGQEGWSVFDVVVQAHVEIYTEVEQCECLRIDFGCWANSQYTTRSNRK